MGTDPLGVGLQSAPTAVELRKNYLNRTKSPININCFSTKKKKHEPVYKVEASKTKMNRNLSHREM